MRVVVSVLLVRERRFREVLYVLVRALVIVEFDLRSRVIFFYFGSWYVLKSSFLVVVNE